MRKTMWQRWATAGTSVVLLACGQETTTPANTDDVSTADVQAGDDTADASDTQTADADPQAAEKAAVAGVKQTEEWQIPGLSAPVQVLRTEGNVAHIYAANRKDLMRAAGFTLARDRFFQMELASRLGLGTLTELLGDAALDTDQGSRSSGSAFVADNILKRLTPAQKEIFESFAEGINAYIDQAVAGKLPVPSEIAVAGGLLGGTPETLMKKWTTRSVAGAAAAIFYNLGFETDDIGRTATLAKLADKWKGKPLGELRTAGAFADIQYNVAPIRPISSAAGLGLDYKGKLVPKTEPGKVPGSLEGKAIAAPKTKTRAVDMAKSVQGVPPLVPPSMVDRLLARSLQREARNGHDRTNGFGSNAWAMSAKTTKDGRALAAGDGHLPLSVPSLFYQIGLDDTLFGQGDEHTLGMMIPGLPIQAVGTNGHIAWNQTQLVGDITDWYREEMVLDDKGAPKATKFGGKDVVLTAVEETYGIANIPALGSKGRTEKWARYVTGDGRWLYDVEGTVVKADYVAKAGETVVNMGGTLVVPGDTDKDGKVTGITFDFTGLDNPDLIGAVDGFAHAKDVFQFRDATRHLMGYSQNVVAADSDGHAFYTGYQAVPCRTYLPRDKDGVWLPGANPKQLIDGTKYGSFTILQNPDGSIDESKNSDPHTCSVPFDEYPNSIDPDQGFVLTANNDPGNLSTDNNLWNDKWYIGGPWANGYRAGTIQDELAGLAKTQSADMATMAKAQGNNISPTGTEWVPFLLASIEAGKAATLKAGPLNPSEQRLADLYGSITPTDLQDVVTRLNGWKTAGFPALSGVETFYHAVASGEVDSAIATTVHNAWFGAFMDMVFGDEDPTGGLNIFDPWGGDARTRALSYFRNGRGPGNPLGQASWNPDTQESAFFDILSTEPVETSAEIALLSLKQALSEETKRFATADHSKWIWGLRHGVHFDSILAEFLGSNPDYAAITEVFSITAESLPLAENIPAGDPRLGLKNFPRGGDGFAVDAAGGVNSGGYGSGPVFRVVWALGKKDGKPWVDGLNTLPGGQSGLTDSLFFSDQAKLWLGNTTMPMRYDHASVVAGATGRELLKP